MDSLSPSIGARVRTVVEGIRGAAIRAGRSPEAVRLMAVSKMVSVSSLREAVEAGIRHIGENRVQEALPKMDTLDRDGVAWHFIGTLQRRKVKAVVGRFDMIHSVDSVVLAQEIDRRAREAGVRQRILLEVNIGAEDNKGGFEPAALLAALPALDRLPSLDIRGLMTIPPPSPTAEGARPYFRRLRELAETLTGQSFGNINMEELSMGMSHDYQVAVEEGATYVRVGTLIFGAQHD